MQVPENATWVEAGVVQSIMGNVSADMAMMVVKAPEKRPVLQEGTCVGLGGNSTTFVGRIVEVFGQVSAPLYVVRYDQSTLPETLDPGTHESGVGLQGRESAGEKQSVATPQAARG